VISRDPVDIRVRLGTSETGWATQHPDGRCTIANLPLADDLAFGDEVELGRPGTDGRPVVLRVLKRTHPYVVRFRYTPGTREAYKAIVEAIYATSLGETEGAIPGIATMALREPLTQARFDAIFAGLNVTGMVIQSTRPSLRGVS